MLQFLYSRLSTKLKVVNSNKDDVMSDKFFFKGRQDARQSTLKHNYNPKNTQKLGSKKYPLTLVVTSEARKSEVEALVADAQLFADISIDTTEGAKESIEDLMIITNKVTTVTVEKTLSRNDPCSCGSGKKFKKCCG